MFHHLKLSINPNEVLGVKSKRCTVKLSCNILNIMAMLMKRLTQISDINTLIWHPLRRLAYNHRESKGRRRSTLKNACEGGRTLPRRAKTAYVNGVPVKDTTFLLS